MSRRSRPRRPTGPSESATPALVAAAARTGNFISSPTDINIDALDNVWFGNAADRRQSLLDLGCRRTLLLRQLRRWRFRNRRYDRWISSAPTFQPQRLVRRSLHDVSVQPRHQGNSCLSGWRDSSGHHGGWRRQCVLHRRRRRDRFRSTSCLVVQAAAAAVAPVQISSTVGANPAASDGRQLPRLRRRQHRVTSGSPPAPPSSRRSHPGYRRCRNLNGFITHSVYHLRQLVGLSVDPQSNVFVSAIDNGAITNSLQAAGTTWATAGGPWPFTAATGRNHQSNGDRCRRSRRTPGSPTAAAHSLSEISFFGPNPLSPSTGFQKASTFLNANNALAVDQAGNVWVAGTGNNFVTEIVGGGVPLYHPTRSASPWAASRQSPKSTHHPTTEGPGSNLPGPSYFQLILHQSNRRKSLRRPTAPPG